MSETAFDLVRDVRGGMFDRRPSTSRSIASSFSRSSSSHSFSLSIRSSLIHSHLLLSILVSHVLRGRPEQSSIFPPQRPTNRVATKQRLFLNIIIVRLTSSTNAQRLVRNNENSSLSLSLSVLFYSLSLSLSFRSFLLFQTYRERSTFVRAFSLSIYTYTYFPLIHFFTQMSHMSCLELIPNSNMFTGDIE